jgi:hypothetical protein
MQWAKNLGELGSHSIRRQASDQKRAGKAQHQHQIRAGSQHRQERVTPQAVFRQGLLESSEASAQCCYSQHSIRLSPRSGCYPVRSGCYSGLPLFKTSLPASQMGQPKSPPLTLGEFPTPPGVRVLARWLSESGSVDTTDSEPGPHEQRSLSSVGKAPFTLGIGKTGQ